MAQNLKTTSDIQAEPAPPLNIPPSDHVVNVSVIDSTARIRVPLHAFVENPLPGHEFLECPVYVFLIEHPSGKNVLFDMAVRKDTNGFSPVVLANTFGATLDVQKDIATILKEDGRVPLEDINAIIWSHLHLDHTGDPSTFPSTTDLIVGPGFKENFLPGYPANPGAVILESDYRNRQLKQIEFTTELKIGRFRALDFFGDGSFYLLDCPGHVIGHICALARTTENSFIFMGGDGCHHCGSLRPSKYLPLPKELSPSPFSTPPHLEGTMCPGTLLEEIHPTHNRTEPYYPKLSFAPDRDLEMAHESIEKMRELDASDDVLIVLAHDGGLLDVIDFFPQSANDWQKKGWKEAARWRFLKDFHHVAHKT